MLPEIRQELRKFAESTTVKGIGRTVRANNGVARTCWIVFLVVCFGLLMFQVRASSFIVRRRNFFIMCVTHHLKLSTAEISVIMKYTERKCFRTASLELQHLVRMC